MKNVILMLAAAAVASGATYWLVSTDKSLVKEEATAELAREHETTQAGMRNELNAAKAQRPVIITVDNNEGEATTVASVEDILTRLQELKAGDKRAKRRAVYFLESLVDRGDAALPPIAAFLEQNVDLELQSLGDLKSQPAKEQKNRGGKGGDKKGAKELVKGGGKGAKQPAAAAWNYFRPFPKPNDSFPATLRLGLLEVITAIGSTQAEKLLLMILENTGRGVEVAYLEIALQDIARDLYVDEILEATRRLLTALPPVTADSMAVDRRAKGYLYAILVKYKDLVFVDTAKTLLITADGRLDGDVLRYLRQVLGTDAMPIFHNVMNDERLTDDLDRYAIRDAILRHIGTDPQADVLLMQTVREGMAQQEEGGAFNWGPMKLPLSALMQGIDEAPAQNIANRRELIENLREEFDHPQLNGALNKMDAGLEAAQQGIIQGGGK
jgi:hypothetical protein